MSGECQSSSTEERGTEDLKTIVRLYPLAIGRQVARAVYWGRLEICCPSGRTGSNPVPVIAITKLNKNVKNK